MVAEGQNTDMNLTVRIHDKEYKKEVVQGITFSEEFNETLDSGTVRLTHIHGQITDLKPYDDVYIYDSDFDFDSHIAQWRKGGDLKDAPFYRHLLVDQYSEEIINLSEGIYSYTIELFSETKGLEVVQCPNVSVTQPLNVKKKVDIYTYLVRFTNLYSPKIKIVDRANEGCWVYAKKYTIAPELKSIFGGFYSQDFTLSNPNLRDILSSLMITKDMIPYVKDGVIYAKDISRRTGTYDIVAEQNSGRVNRIVGQMSSADYCDGVRRQYSDALSQNGICDFIEYLGFRNKNEALMVLDNSQLEVANKIYRIKKINLCYYKKSYVTYENTSISPWYFYKVDISCLVKPKNEWDLLSQDWRALDNTLAKVSSIDDLSKYKLSTLYYEIGGKTIGGWGQRYNRLQTSPLNTWDYQKSSLENIIKTLDNMNLSGDINRELYLEELNKKYGWKIDEISIVPDTVDNMYNATGNSNASLIQKYKTVFFEIEYEGFYDGALVHSRDNGRDNFYQNDNVSSSLTLLEKDGVNQKEKLNRFANKTHVINGRLDGVNYDVSKLLQLGNTGKIGNDDDVIIYRREYSIYNNYISVSYAGIQDYVLKNFYTNVYAKYRVNQLMSYGESVLRAENKKVLLVLSKDKKQKNEEDTFFNIKTPFVSNGNEFYSSDIKDFLSAFSASSTEQHINTVELNKQFFTECYSFSSGNIACFNFQMIDNITGGNYIDKWVSADYQLLLNHPSDNEDYYVGAKQKWLNVVDDDETGAMKNLSVSLSHTDYNNELLSDDPSSIYAYSQILPMSYYFLGMYFFYKDRTKSKEISFNEKIYKDNKERINYTLQIEPISDTKDIVFSEYLIRLSNLILHDNNKKLSSNREITIGSASTVFVPIKISTSKHIISGSNFFQITIGFEEPSTFLDKYLSERQQGEGGKLPFTTTIELKTTTGDIYFHYESHHIYWIISDMSGAEETYRVIEGAGYYKHAGETHPLTNLWCAYRDASTYGRVDSDGYWWINDDASAINPFPTETFWNQAQLGIPDIQQEKTSTLQKNMFLQYSQETITEDIKYQVMTGSDFEKSLSDKSVSSVFSVESVDNPSLIVDVTDITEVDSNSNIKILNGIKSIRYWYFDFDAAYAKDYTNSAYVYQYTPEKSGYYFVFGINIHPEDVKVKGNKRYIEIYITKTTNRDERVFDGVGRQVGVLGNIAGAFPKPQSFEYTPIATYPKGEKTITLNSFLTSSDGAHAHAQQWRCYNGETIQPSYNIAEPKNYYGTNIEYWLDSNGNKHEDGYSMVVSKNETLTFVGTDWYDGKKTVYDTASIMNLSKDNPIKTDTESTLLSDFHIEGDPVLYPILVEGYCDYEIQHVSDGKSIKEQKEPFRVRLFSDWRIVARALSTDDSIWITLKCEKTDNGDFLTVEMRGEKKSDDDSQVYVKAKVVITRIEQSYIAPTLEIEAPQVTGSVYQFQDPETAEETDMWDYNIVITNPNSFTCYLDYKLFRDGDTVVDYTRDTDKIAIASNDSYRLQGSWKDSTSMGLARLESSLYVGNNRSEETITNWDAIFQSPASVSARYGSKDDRDTYPIYLRVENKNAVSVVAHWDLGALQRTGTFNIRAKTTVEEIITYADTKQDEGNLNGHVYFSSDEYGDSDIVSFN